MAVAQQHEISPFNIGRFETQRRKSAAAIKVGIEQNELAERNKFLTVWSCPLECSRPNDTSTEG